MSDKKNTINIPSGVKKLGSELVWLGYSDKIIIPKTVSSWQKEWKQGIYSSKGKVIIIIKSKNPPRLEGGKQSAVPTSALYKIPPKSLNKYKKWFRKLGYSLKPDKQKKLYSCMVV